MNMWIILLIVAVATLLLTWALTSAGVIFTKHEREEAVSPEFAADDHPDAKPGTSV